MKKIAHRFTVPVLAVLMGYATQASAGSAPSSAALCPADAKFQSRVDPKLNALSLEELTAASDKGNLDAKVLLGLRYVMGDKPDYEKGVPLFKAAADKKNADGEYYMGVAYLNGSGVPKDEAQAAAWFHRSADRGHAMSQYWFGEMTSKGRGGLKEDWKAALPYFKKAAAGGVPTALLELGHMYSTGKGGLPVDYEKSADCFRVADKLGLGLARYNLSLLIGDGKVKAQPGDPQKVESSTLSVEPKN